jgi:hypothetical protein
MSTPFYRLFFRVFLLGLELPLDYLSWFYIESKAFVLSVPEGGSILQLAKRRHGLSRVMLVEKVVRLAEDSDFINSSREGNRAFIAHKGSNKA